MFNHMVVRKGKIEVKGFLLQKPGGFCKDVILKPQVHIQVSQGARWVNVLAFCLYNLTKHVLIPWGKSAKRTRCLNVTVITLPHSLQHYQNVLDQGLCPSKDI